MDLRTAVATFAKQHLPYEGIVSGRVDAFGDLKQPDALTAQARLVIAPGSHGIPLSGRLNGDYSGARGAVHIDDSYLALPHTRLSLAGSTTSALRFVLTTSDPSDLVAAVAKTPAPVVLNAPATFTGSVTGALSAPKISGRLAAGGDSMRFKPMRRSPTRVRRFATAASGGIVCRPNFPRRWACVTGRRPRTRIVDCARLGFRGRRRRRGQRARPHS